MSGLNSFNRLAVPISVPDVPSNAVRNIVGSAPVFTIAKVNDPTTPRQAGAPITYRLTVANNGNENATNVIVQDNLPAGATYLPGSATGGSSVNVVTVGPSVGST